MKSNYKITKDFENRIKKLEEKLGYKFRNKYIPLAAITHSSFVAEYKEKIQDYEVLEFLGDAVIGLIVSEILIKTFPNAKEGELSKIRSAVVSESYLARLAKKLGLNELVLLSRGEKAQKGMERETLLCDIFEAIFGAIYMDSDFSISPAREVFNKHFKDYMIQCIKNDDIPQDYKSILQVYTQKKFKTVPKYKLIHQEGPEHNKEFTIQCTVDNFVKTTGKGKSKKEAETKAAQEAYKILKDKFNLILK